MKISTTSFSNIRSLLHLLLATALVSLFMIEMATAAGRSGGKPPGVGAASGGAASPAGSVIQPRGQETKPPFSERPDWADKPEDPRVLKGQRPGEAKERKQEVKDWLEGGED